MLKVNMGVVMIRIFAAVAVLLSTAASLVDAQVGDAYALTVSFKRTNVYVAGVPASVELGGSWPDYCGPSRITSAFDEAKKEFNVDIYFATAPCTVRLSEWQYTLPERALPQGRYRVVIHAGQPASGSYTYATTSFSVVEKSASPVLIESQSLLTNPGVADAEQFMQVTSLETCPGFELKPLVTRNQGSIEVRLVYSFSLMYICPAAAPPPRAVSRLVSLGKLPLGTYDVTVNAGYQDVSTTILREKLTINKPGTAASITGAWYDPNESGWGMTFIESNGVVFATWYVHESKKPFWYTMTGAKRNGAVIRGDIATIYGARDYYANWDPTVVGINQLGEAVITFLDTDSASVTSVLNTYFNSGTVTRNIKRLKF